MQRAPKEDIFPKPVEYQCKTAISPLSLLWKGVGSSGEGGKGCYREFPQQYGYL